MYTDGSVQTVPLTSLFGRLGLKRRHQVIKEKSERKNKRGRVGGKQRGRPVGRQMIDSLTLLLLKT